MLRCRVPESAIGMRSCFDGVAWPAIPSQSGALLLSMLYQFERTQWLPPERLIERQLLQVSQLLRHADESVAFYRRRFDAAGWRPGGAITLADFCALPLLTRRDIQSAGTALFSSAVPAHFGKVVEKQTSGSTGEPVKIRSTSIDQLLSVPTSCEAHGTKVD